MGIAGGLVTLLAGLLPLLARLTGLGVFVPLILRPAWCCSPFGVCPAPRLAGLVLLLRLLLTGLCIAGIFLVLRLSWPGWFCAFWAFWSLAWPCCSPACPERAGCFF